MQMDLRLDWIALKFKDSHSIMSTGLLFHIKYSFYFSFTNFTFIQDFHLPLCDVSYENLRFSRTELGTSLFRCEVQKKLHGLLYLRISFSLSYPRTEIPKF